MIFGPPHFVADEANTSGQPCTRARLSSSSGRLTPMHGSAETMARMCSASLGHATDSQA